MTLGVNERKRYMDRHGCNKINADLYKSNNPLICIDPSGKMYSKNSTAKLHSDTDIVVILDPITFVHQSDIGDNQYSIAYNNGIQFKIPRPLADLDLVSKNESGLVSASLDSLFDISEDMMQLIMRSIPRQIVLG